MSSSASQTYSDLLDSRRRSLARLDRLHSRMGAARLAIAGCFLLLLWVCFARGAASPEWLLLPAAAFAALVFTHQRIRRQRASAQRAVAFYQQGLERLRGRWPEGGPTGARFLDFHHVYGADLDLFGAQSLFQRLCTARTPMGESALAGWLLAPANVETIRERHVGIAELRERVELREDLQILGETSRIDLHGETLTRWVDAPKELSRQWLRVTAALLAAGAIASALLWVLRGWQFPFLAVVSAEAALNYALRERVSAAVAGVEHAYEDLKLLSLLLRRIEAQSFQAAPLNALQARLRSADMTASKTLSSLATLVNFVEARRNPILVPLMLPLLYTVQAALAAERWRQVHGRSVAAWLSVLGDVEALESIAAYSFEHPADPFPEFVQGDASFIARGLGHPLIPRETRVRNDVDISGEIRGLLVSGSNMSGKSTLLRSVGVNTILAMAGAPVCAARLRLTPLQVGASIRTNDSLHEGSSRFYAEITRLRQLFEPYPLPLLFLLDELLQGTNSADRRIGARGVIRALLARGAIGLISTHDLALTDGAQANEDALKNVHFQDELVDGRLNFDFTLRDGVVTKSNGIELMRAIGLDV